VQALRLLSDAERALMTRVYLQRQSYQQIADETGALLNTVGTRILRAKKRLRRILEPVVERRLAACPGRCRSPSRAARSCGEASVACGRP
jgi:hypothetical protein